MNSKPTYQELEEENNILRQKLNVSEKNENFRNYFEYNKAVMLQIHSETKEIINANEAAINFYGYSKKDLLKKHN